MYNSTALVAQHRHHFRWKERREHEYSLTFCIMFDPMAELAGDEPQPTDDSSASDAGAQQQSGGGRFSDEVHSVTIHARQRTFYIDLKQSSNGKFFKVSEKSRGGRKTTIMFDSEDLDRFIEAFQEMKNHV